MSVIHIPTRGSFNKKQTIDTTYYQILITKRYMKNDGG